MLTYKSDTLTVSRKTGNALVRAVRSSGCASIFTISIESGRLVVSANINSNGPNSVYIGDRYVRDISISGVLAMWRLYVDSLRLRKKLSNCETMFIRS